jgi:hypothetical protein
VNELSYGLLRRFAFIEIDNPKDKKKEEAVVLDRVKSDLSDLDQSKVLKYLLEVQFPLNKFFDFVHEIRKRRNIGLSTSIDVVRYLIAGMIKIKKDPWKLLDEAITDYILPQLDRLELETLRHIFGAAQNMFTDDNNQQHCTGFILKLDDMIKKLGQMDKLFKASYE